jgi:hypothetical protein
MTMDHPPWWQRGDPPPRSELFPPGPDKPREREQVTLTRPRPEGRT